MPFKNGEIPYSVVSVVLASGTDSNGYWEFRCTPAFAARWAFAKQYALEHFGRTIYVRTGWNIYRPLSSQYTARTNACKAGNCAGAAWPGSSSHGGEWNGRQCLAVDVDPNGLSWAQVDEAMVAAGFSAGLITQAISGIRGGEPWHYIDFNAFGAVPAGNGSHIFGGFLMALNDQQQQEVYDVLAELRIVLGAAGARDIPEAQRADRSILANMATLATMIRRIQVGQDNTNAYLYSGGPGVDQTLGASNSIFGLILNLAGRAVAGPADVDEAALAAALIPLLAANVGSLSDEDVKRLAVAAADEEDRRDRERPRL